MNEHHKTPWLAIVLAVLAIISFIACLPRQGGYVEIMSGGSYEGTTRTLVPPPSAGVPQADNTAAQSPASMPAPYYGGGDVPVTDTREFLKTDYSATMRTRDVSGLTARAETTIRGYGGRIDQSSSADKNGYIQFVVPLSKFNDFRNELEHLVPSRFITIQISTQNMLPQKQDIEATQKQVEQHISDLQVARSKVVASHAITAKSLQVRINVAQVELNALRALPNPGATQQARMATLSSTIASLQSSLASENTSYANTLASYDAQIKYANTSLTAVKTQDQALLDTVATVRGTINIEWISLWDIARLYLPGFWIPAIFAALSLLSYLWERRLWIFKR